MATQMSFFCKCKAKRLTGPKQEAHLKHFQRASREILWVGYLLPSLPFSLHSTERGRRWGSHPPRHTATSHSASNYARAADQEIVWFLQFKKISSNWVTSNGEMHPEWAPHCMCMLRTRFSFLMQSERRLLIIRGPESAKKTMQRLNYVTGSQH